METTMHQYRNHGIITSKDHRVVQAIAMKTVADAHKQNCGIRLIREQYKIEVYNEQQTIRTVTILHPEAVNKTWVRFWNFLEDHAPKVQQ